MAGEDLTKVKRVMLRLPAGLVRWVDGKVTKAKRDGNTAANRNSQMASIIKDAIRLELDGKKA